MPLFQELSRRNVFRVAIAYLAAAWLLIEVADTLFPAFGIPGWAFRFVVILLALGFVPTLIFSWAYEITSEGLKREKDVVREESVSASTARRLDVLTIGLIVVALVFIVVDRIWLKPEADPMVTALENAREEVLDPVENETGFVLDSIAVLPFTNRSANPEDAFFADGIHDDLLTHISRIGSIKTISRTSVMKYRDTTLTIPEIARELDVVTVLEGGVQRAGSQVRINVQLIDARKDDHLWSEIYDKQLTATNIFEIQSEIARSIAAALSTRLSPEDQVRISKVPTENMAALERYFLGRQFLAKRNRIDLAKAIQNFEEAVDLDPDFALAWVGLADTVLIYNRDVDRSRKAAEMALQLDPGLGEAHAADAKRRGWQGDIEGSEAAFRHALQLSPNYAPTYQWYGQMLGHHFGQSRMDEVLELFDKAVSLDPNSAIILNDYAGELLRAGRLEAALNLFQKAVDVDPQFSRAYYGIGAIQGGYYGRLDKNLLNYRKGLAIDPGSYPTVKLRLGTIRLNLGDIDQASFWLDQFNQQVSEETVPELAVAIHLRLGEHDSALQDASRTLETRSDSPISLRMARDHEINAGNLAEARELFENAFPELFTPNEPTVNEDNWHMAADVAYLLIQTGEQEQAERLLEVSLSAVDSKTLSLYRSPRLAAARIHALREDFPQAIEAIRSAIDQNWRWDAWFYLKHDPILAPLHDNSEFQALAAEIEADLARQLGQVREWEAKDLLPPAPSG
jgi:TolB-like protein/predicted Zn-dependent protease